MPLLTLRRGTKSATVRGIATDVARAFTHAEHELVASRAQCPVWYDNEGRVVWE
jgi:hypothetical protein